MRGKVDGVACDIRFAGITPAYAGKRVIVTHFPYFL